MIKRKGQIVPKYLFESKEKKARHLVTFGCDVQITGRKISALSPGPCIISVREDEHIFNNKRKIRVKGFRFFDLEFFGMGKAEYAINMMGPLSNLPVRVIEREVIKYLTGLVKRG